MSQRFIEKWFGFPGEEFELRRVALKMESAYGSVMLVSFVWAGSHESGSEIYFVSYTLLHLQQGT